MGGVGGARRGITTEYFIDRTKVVHQILAKMMRKAFPDEWRKYHDSYAAGRWLREDTKYGMWLGRAVVWKLQINLHRDCSDGESGICCCFNGGDYKPACDGGGMMVFPDLDLTFA